MPSVSEVSSGADVVFENKDESKVNIVQVVDGRDGSSSIDCGSSCEDTMCLAEAYNMKWSIMSHQECPLVSQTTSATNPPATTDVSGRSSILLNE